MKAMMRILLIAFVLPSLFAFTEKKDIKEINIRNLPSLPIPRSVVSVVPFKVWEHDTFVEVEFHHQTGNVLIEILNAAGTAVVEKTVDGDVLEHAEIYIDHLSAGTYIVRLTITNSFNGIYIGTLQK